MKLFYVPRFAAWTVLVLQQQVIIDKAQKAPTLGADIIALELLFEAFLLVNGTVGCLTVKAVGHNQQRNDRESYRVRSDGLTHCNK